MAGAPRTISAAVLRALLAALASSGVDATLVLQRHGVALETLNLPEGRVPANVAFRIFDEAPALAGDEPWLADVERVLLSSEPFAFSDAHAAAAQVLCPNARVDRVDGELLSWYGARAVAGLGYLRALADDNRPAA